MAKRFSPSYKDDNSFIMLVLSQTILKPTQINTASVTFTGHRIAGVLTFALLVSNLVLRDRSEKLD